MLTTLIFAACDGPASLLRPASDARSADLVGAGDIASCAWDADEQTAALLDVLPGTVFTLGDNVYEQGTPKEFAECYHPTWGRHLGRTRPVVGNHEYETTGATGYFAYFGSAAGDPDKGYYSYELGAWHIVVLNSEIEVGEGSPQLAWLRQDLEDHPVRCVAVLSHRPFFSGGGDEVVFSEGRAALELLYAAGVDIALGGHAHHYERFAPQTPDRSVDEAHGIRAFVVGTGGAETHGFKAPDAPNSVVQGREHGVILLQLHPTSYDWEFIPIAGMSFRDAGSGACHDPPP